MSTFRNLLIMENQLIRDFALRNCAEVHGRDHIWTPELTEIERDNYDTDDELRGKPTRERVHAQGGRLGRSTELNATGDAATSTLSSEVELTTHEHHQEGELGSGTSFKRPRTLDASSERPSIIELETHDCHASPEDGCLCDPYLQTR